MDQKKTLANMKEWKLSTTRLVTYSTKDSAGVEGTGIGRDLSASNWLWEVLGHPLHMVATLRGGLQGWVAEGRPLEAGLMSDSGPRKLFTQEELPTAFSLEANAYEKAQANQKA